MVLWPHACSLAALLLAFSPSIHGAVLVPRDSTGAAGYSNGLLVNTESGKVQGFFNDTAKTVRAYLGVPFAAAPVKDLRFMPPAKRPRSSSTIQATSWPATCPGLYPNQTNIYTILPYYPFTRQDEDCLLLNVWTPSVERMKKLGNKPLPVLIYIYGGAFDQGGISLSVYEPTDLVANHDVVVVMPNYRVTIFGNPNSPYLASKPGPKNVGLLDQRFAVEWIQRNVAAFGGDPKRMIAFGQSAGGVSCGFMEYAYPQNPIVAGIGQLSGPVTLPGIFLSPYAIGNFTDLASNVGCANSTSTDYQTFKCMQHVPFATLTNFINTHPEKGYLFRLVVDNQTVFTDVPQRIASGRVSKIPTFLGSLDNEGDSLVPFSYDGIDQAAADVFGNVVLKCPTANEAKLRIDAGLPTWRYRYSGIYPNLNPFDFIRTYHSSDVPMWLGAVNAVPGLASGTTAEQKKQSAYMQGALVAFAYDPKAGLTKYGWPMYTGTNGKTLVHMDPRNSSKVVVLENPAGYDAPCRST
ncbi:hypothetical protein FRC09_005865 [Ceratobasidium sp. 395]|nr:hypothetical protein FRC09_005865 [Ceratobasidium sp. 395]